MIATGWFAVFAARAGENEPTIEQLKADSTAHLIPATDVEVAAVCDPLRGDPRFEKIVASLAPK